MQHDAYIGPIFSADFSLIAPEARPRTHSAAFCALNATIVRWLPDPLPTGKEPSYHDLLLLRLYA